MAAAIDHQREIREAAGRLNRWSRVIDKAKA